jgi:ornithine cyclodeaminase/alanine dehydrogenase-like protein (mu-crystallin family)
MIPLGEGAITEASIVAELGELASGLRSWERRPGDVTLFKSLGIAIEDVAAARFVYESARQRGLGTEIALGGVAMVHGSA